MATSVKRTTDKTTRRIAKLERELQDAQTRISELTARVIIMGAGLGYQPVARAVGDDLVAALAPEYHDNVIPFRPRSAR